MSGSPLDASKRYRLGTRAEKVSDQIELGAVTLRQLGKHVGDTVAVGTGRTTRRLTVVGIVTLPSIGVGLTDHVDLGTGAMLSEATLLSVEGLHSFNTSTNEAISALPSTVAIDLAPGVRPRSVVRPIVQADPGGTSGGVYQVRRVLGASIVNANQMSGQPLALALALGVAALVSLSAAVAASARRRRRELASCRPSASPEFSCAALSSGRRLRCCWSPSSSGCRSASSPGAGAGPTSPRRSAWYPSPSCP